MKGTSVHLELSLWETAKRQALLREWKIQSLTASALLDYLNTNKNDQWKAYKRLGGYRESLFKKAGVDRLVIEQKTNLYFDEELKLKIKEHCKIRYLSFGGVVAASLLRFSGLSISDQKGAYRKLTNFRKRLLDNG